MTRPQQGYVSVDSIYPHSGMDSIDPATLINPQFSPLMENVVVTDGLLRSRSGYLTLGNSLIDPVMELIEWSTESGARQLVAITTKYQFKFDKTTDKWINISQDGGELDVCRQFTAGSSPRNIVLTGDQSSVYSAGDYIKIIGTTNAGVYQAVSVNFSNPDTDIVVSDNVLAVATTNGATDETASLVVPSTGTINNPIDWVVGTDDTDTYLFVTNGIDNVLWYDGTGQFSNYNPADINAGGSFKATTVALFFNHLVFGNFTDAATKEKYLIWSNDGNFQEADGFTSGVNDTAGEQLLPDSQGPILKLLNLGDRLAIYSENAIGLFAFVGGNLVFSYEQVLRETRLLSPRAIVNLGPFHIYISQENFYLFDGTRLLRTVGDAAQGDYRGNINLDLANQAFAFHDSPVNEVYFVIPTSGTTTRIYLVEYDLFKIENTRWSPHVYNDQITSMGFFTRGDEVSTGTGLTWDAGILASTSWTGGAKDIDQTLPWNSGSIREGFPVRILGTQAGVTFQSDGISQDDNGTSFTSVWNSKDFTFPQVYASEFGRWIDVDVELRGAKVTIDISVDAGISWKNVVTDQVLTSNWTRYKFPVDVFGETCRLRFYTNGSGFSLKWLRIWVRPGGAR